MPERRTTDLPPTDADSTSTVIVNTTGGDTRVITLNVVLGVPAMTTQAIAGDENTTIMSPSTTREAVAAYGLQADHGGYSEKLSPAGTDLVLIRDSVSGLPRRARISAISTTGAPSGIRRATDSEAKSLVASDVAITPATLRAVAEEKRLFLEKFGPKNAVSVDIDRSFTILEGPCERAFLPEDTSGLNQVLIENGTTRKVEVFGFEGRIAAGAHFNGHTCISFPRSAALGGLESTANIVRMTGMVMFSADSFPASSFRTLVACCDRVTGAFRGWELVYNAGTGHNIVFRGYGGTSSNPTFTATSPSEPFRVGQIVEVAFSFDLSLRAFSASLNGVRQNWAVVWPSSGDIASAASGRGLRVGATTTGLLADQSFPHIGNISRVALWADWHTPSPESIGEGVVEPEAPAGPLLPQPTGMRALSGTLFGVTVDDVANVTRIVDSSRALSRFPTTRVVFDENVQPAYYTGPVNSIQPVSYIMGELLDSVGLANSTVAAYGTRADAYLAALGDKVDLWEVGNEVNGNWTGPYASVRDKIYLAWQKVNAAGKRSELSLWYNYGCGNGPSELGALEFSEQYVPQDMRNGLHYVLISYYETQCGNQRPSQAVWQAFFDDLGALYPNSYLGFAEIGFPDPVTTNQAAAESMINFYYNLNINHPRYVGGYFWWYYYEDMLPHTTKPLWNTLNAALQSMPQWS